MKNVNFTHATTEIVIEYKTLYSHGTVIYDTNFYTKYHKKIMKTLKDCEIISMIERRKEDRD